MKEVFTTDSPGATEELGVELSKRFKEGDRVALVGELGSGKTRFVRGVARGLGSRGFIKSPSFTIINIYEGGRLPLYHIDLYRISRPEEFESAGLEEYVYGRGVSIIEWAERLPGLMKDATYVVRFAYRGEHSREIEVETRL